VRNALNPAGTVCDELSRVEARLTIKIIQHAKHASNRG